MSYANQGTPENRQIAPGPPYNATNFNADNATIFSTLQTYARTFPNYPLPTGSDEKQVHLNIQNVSYFNTLNQQVQDIKTKNNGTTLFPYPTFKSESERLMYIQGQLTTAARNRITGQNSCSTIYQIINS
jgi:hypothetical protein